ncbi:MAG: tRNA 2-thiouridine(34) synthase MnmA [Bacteroidales bacterium]|jgi:tRNA-specific 2-thiouridylase|nr:tRNA 2-thiouridine(34) synthase MnmA [Bacteroidales bacterium]
MKGKVVIGMSGGVDSSVAAYLLKQQGYEVIGLFMKNWDDSSVTLTSNCTWEDDLLFADMVSKKLDIPLHTVDLSDYYRKRVVEYMFSEYERGRTPNPDVLCNREIKFDVFIDECLKLGAEHVATGHYCRQESVEIEGKKIYRLLAGADPNKDQSYFLCQLSQKQISRALFPIGNILKPEVRRIADEQGLATATRKDSQGICFVGKVDLPTFLQQKLKAQKGDIIEIPESYYENLNISDELSNLSKAYQYEREDGKVMAEHRGAHFYTIGQRKGLNIGGTGKPMYVIAIDVVENVVYVGRGDEHPGLYRKALFISNEEMHWVRPDLKLQLDDSRDYLVRIRYRQPLQNGTLISKSEGFYIKFDVPQRGIAPGQFAAWYDKDELIGSGVIA